MKQMSLQYQINLTAKLGKNSYYDDGKALIIKNVVAFAPGKFIGCTGEITDIGEEAVKATDWKDLLMGRPVIEGHEEVNTYSFDNLIRGSVKAVRSNAKVIVDLIIYDTALQGKIISGDQ